MLDKVRSYVELNSMIVDDDNIVVGISGGADSVCLLVLLKELQKFIRFSITAIHVNHGIRGDEAARDEKFTQELCDKSGVVLKVVHINVPQLAKNENLSLEEAGRKARYDIFAKEAGTGKIAVAHHMDDQSETVLMNILRGSAMKGLCGMQPVRDNIVRPLLCVRRQDIEEYLNQCGQSYIVDSTNLDNNYMRNKIRNVVIPYVEDNVNPKAVCNISGMAQMITEAEQYISNQAELAYLQCITYEKADLQEIKIDMNHFSGYDTIIKKYVIRSVLSKIAGRLKDIYRVHIETILALENKKVGSHADLAYGIKAERGYDCIQLFKAEKSKTDRNKTDRSTTDEIDVEISLENMTFGDKRRYEPMGQWYLNGQLKTVSAIEFELLDSDTTRKITQQEKIIGNDYTKLFDYDKMNFILHMRNRQTGDTIVIDRLGRTKKLKDFFIDRKVPKEYRDQVMLISDTTHILWAVGLRISEEYKVDMNSKHILKINIL